jgi:hypothetical protein
LIRFELDPPITELANWAAEEEALPDETNLNSSGNATVRIQRSEIFFETSKVLDSE